MTHGMSKTPTYKAWKGMRNRCNNLNASDYKDYGGRGITICKKWNKFESFLKDMGEKPKDLTIERIDNEKSYSPDNCKWATQTDQSRNRRIRKTNKTGITGVCWNDQRKKYCAHITTNYKQRCLGFFVYLQDAIEARKTGELKYWNIQKIQE